MAEKEPTFYIILDKSTYTRTGIIHTTLRSAQQEARTIANTSAHTFIVMKAVTGFRKVHVQDIQYLEKEDVE